MKEVKGKLSKGKELSFQVSEAFKTVAGCNIDFSNIDIHMPRNLRRV
jgi:hypothetical protein